MRQVEIVGGGLAGLSLGLALRRHGVPVVVHEAGGYPRTKVCGEFITGLDAATIRDLELEGVLTGAPRHHHAAWFGPGGALLTLTLPEPAIGLRRHELDTRLAERFAAAGGELRAGVRIPPAEAAGPGRVLANGRRHERAGLIGLKQHVRGLTLAADLEMHLGDGAYVGLAPVDAGAVNVCGLFQPRALPPGPAASVFDRSLRAAGLGALADRLAQAERLPGMSCAIAGARFGRVAAHGSGVAIGDAYAAIPPFTGHGMAMAFQGAAAAVGPLIQWAEGRAEWDHTARLVERRLARRFRVRLTAAQALHPFLFARRCQRLAAGLHARRLLPVRSLYHLLH